MISTSLAVLVAAFSIILTLSRIPLKLFYIDTITGFYSSGNVFGIIYNLMFFAFLILSVLFYLKNKKDFDGNLRVGINRSVICSIAGIVISVASAMRFKQSFALDFCQENCAPKFLVFPAHILGIICGGLILLLSLSLFSGSVEKKISQISSLVLPIWCAVLSLTDFLSFRFTLYSSDELMSTIFMISSTLFFLYFSKSIIFTSSDNKEYIVPAAVTVLSGTAVALPQTIALLLLSPDISGPTLLQSINMLSVSAVAFCFILAPSRKSK